MSLIGIFMMATSYVVVTSLLVFCFVRVLTTPEATAHSHAPLDIDTHDDDPPSQM